MNFYRSSFALAALLSFALTAPAAQYYAAPNGSGSGAGTQASPWDLATALSQHSIVGGDTLWLMGGTYHGTFVSYLDGTASAPIIVRQMPGQRAIIDGGNSNGQGIFTIYSNYVWFWGFEIMSSDPQRVSKSTSSAPPDIPRGEGVDFAQVAGDGVGVKLIDLVIHDTRQGVSFWEQAENAEIYGCVIYNNGWDGPSGDRGHGHGIYTQNQTGTKHINNNLVFRQFGEGINQYGSGTSYIENYEYDSNVIFHNGEPSIFGLDRDVLIGGEVGSQANNITFTNNLGYGSVFKFGYTGEAQNVSLANNYHYADGDVLEMNVSGLSMSGDMWAGSVVGLNPSSYPDNTYVAYNTKPSGLHVFVRPEKYDTNRASVVIYNWSDLTTVPVDLSSFLKNGDNYQILDAQNYLGAAILSGTYQGGSVSVPVSKLSAVAQPIGNAQVKVQHTSVEYNALVVVRTSSGSGAPAKPVYLYQEAENASLTSPMTVKSSSSASNGKYISSGTADDGTATFTFNISTAGTYVLWCHVLAPNSNQDSFFVSADGGAEDIYDDAEGSWGNSWQWTVLNGRNGTDTPLTLNPRTFSFSAGTHTIRFRGREANSALDAVDLTNDMSYKP